MIVLHFSPSLNHFTHLQWRILTAVPIVNHSVLVATCEVFWVLPVPGDGSDGGFMPRDLPLLHLHLLPIVDASIIVLDGTFFIANSENSTLVPFKAGDTGSSPTPGHLLGLDIPEFDVVGGGSQGK